MTWPIALERDIHPYGLVRASLDGRDLLVWAMTATKFASGRIGVRTAAFV
jgi:hypothetical protein